MKTMWFYPFKKQHFLDFFEEAKASPQEFYDWFLITNTRHRIIRDAGGRDWHFPCVRSPFKNKLISSHPLGVGNFLESKWAIFEIWNRTIKWPWYRARMIKGYLMMFPEVI